MTAHLPAGQFFGRTVDSWHTPAFALSESVYEPHTTLAPHAHARPYLCLVLQGGHLETSGRHVRDCGPSTVVVHPAGERHANRFTSAGGHLFRLEFDEAWIATKCDGFDVPAEFHGGPMSLLAGRMFHEFRRPDDLSPLMIEALTLEFAVGAVRTQTRESADRGPEWMVRVRDYLHANYAVQIRLDDLAREAGVHAAHLNRAFRARHDCSIGEYTRRLRVGAAARLLTESSATLAEVAAASGFADQSHFTRVFTRITGLTPGRYRAARST